MPTSVIEGNVPMAQARETPPRSRDRVFQLASHLEAQPID